MANELKIVIDADVSRAVSGIEKVSQAIASDFVGATKAASASAEGLQRVISSFQASINSINVSGLGSEVDKLNNKLKGLAEVDIKVDPAKALSAIKDVSDSLSSLKSSDIILRLNDGKVLQQIQSVDKLLDSLTATVNIQGQIDEAEFKRRLAVLTSKTAEIDIKADITQIDAQIKSLREKLSVVSVVDIEANPSQALAAINDVLQDINKIKSAEFLLNADTDPALAEIAELQARLKDVKASILLTADDSLVQTEIKSLQAKLSTLEANIPLNVSATGFEKLQAEIAETKAAISSLQNRKVRIDVNSGVNSLKVLDKQLDQTSASAVAFGSTVQKGTQVANAALAKLPNTTNRATNALVDFGRIIQDAPYAVLSRNIGAVANNFNPLLESFGRLKAETGSASAAFKALGNSLLGPAGIGIAVSVVSSLLVLFGDKLFNTGKKAEEAADKIKTINDSLKEIQGQAAKEASETLGLVAILKNETETRERKLTALKELKQIQPEIFGQLKLEGDAVAGLDAAYQSYLQQLRLVITAKLKQAQLEQITQKILEKEGLTLTKSQAEGLKVINKITGEVLGKQQQSIKTGNATAGVLAIQNQQLDRQQKSVDELNTLYKDQNALIKELTELSKGIELKIPKPDTKEFDKFRDEVISKAQQFKKEFGEAFIIDENLEISFFHDKNAVFKEAQKLIGRANEFLQGNVSALKIRIPVNADFDLIPIQTEFITKEIEDAFFQGAKKDLEIPITITPDISLEKGNRDLRDKVNDLRKQFSIFGDLGFKEFGKIDFSNLNAGIAEATKRLQGMMEIANTLNQAIGQGLTSAFNSVFDAVLEGKNVFKALGNAVKELIVTTIKAVAQMLILKAITNFIFPGGGGALSAASKVFTLQANPISSGGIGNSAFQNVIGINVTGQISGDTIRLAGQRAANSQGRFGG